MLQAIALSKLVRNLREQKELHIICFTGYRLETIKSWPVMRGVGELLSQIDVLIDGPYIESLNHGNSFAGSTNQRILTLSDRAVPGDGTFSTRNMEIHIRNRSILAVGIPPKGWKKEWISATG